ncbi:MAG: hypothetical protein A3E01_06700 [Gammaproteobacteria bacterium RIFCSPHIGHO2_12_FULL_63_22]|nr:MAG: hypothetical protein A3E01_06700 [Gammaproteobacteria bacterium RIFCSPHIGHO2_12_FULL_63_22]
MIDLSRFLYSPAIRTRRAELVGLSKLEDAFAAGLLPLFELTRSRRTKSNPAGSVEASIVELLSIVDSNPFVADVTSLASLSNSEVEKLLDPTQDFENWRDFVAANLPETAIPVVHITEPYDGASVSKQAESFLERHDCIAVRVPSEFENVEDLFRTLEEDFRTLERVLVYADVAMVTERGLAGALARTSEIAALVEGLHPGLFVSLASSFPSTVTPFGDQSGTFRLHEVAISEYLKEEFEEMRCLHGDYACIHPRDMEGIAINWVPRVDVPLADSLYYHRFRRQDGGYVRAAEAALSSPSYEPLNCWADENIRLAAAGNPAGRAPAFWISVRLNFHLERQLVRLGA